FKLEAPGGGSDTQLAQRVEGPLVDPSRLGGSAASEKEPHELLRRPLVRAILGKKPSQRRRRLVELASLLAHASEKQLQLDPRLTESRAARNRPALGDIVAQIIADVEGVGVPKERNGVGGASRRRDEMLECIGVNPDRRFPAEFHRLTFADEEILHRLAPRLDKGVLQRRHRRK